jgi:hypothetical protein
MMYCCLFVLISWIQVPPPRLLNVSCTLSGSPFALYRVGVARATVADTMIKENDFILVENMKFGFERESKLWMKLSIDHEGSNSCSYIIRS